MKAGRLARLETIVRCASAVMQVNPAGSDLTVEVDMVAYRHERRTVMGAWRVLARGEHGVGVARCPEGHIHLELERGEFTLRFDDPHFLAFARTVMAAATAVAGRHWDALAPRVDERLPRH